MYKLWEVSVVATTIRTLLFIIGHFIIGLIVLATIGVSIETVTFSSLIGLTLNGVWFWIIDRWWSQRHYDEESKMREEAFYF